MPSPVLASLIGASLATLLITERRCDWEGLSLLALTVLIRISGFVVAVASPLGDDSKTHATHPVVHANKMSKLTTCTRVATPMRP